MKRKAKSFFTCGFCKERLLKEGYTYEHECRFGDRLRKQFKTACLCLLCGEECKNGGERHNCKEQSKQFTKEVIYSDDTEYCELFGHEFEIIPNRPEEVKEVEIDTPNDYREGGYCQPRTIELWRVESNFKKCQNCGLEEFFTVRKIKLLTRKCLCIDDGDWENAEWSAEWVETFVDKEIKARRAKSQEE